MKVGIYYNKNHFSDNEKYLIRIKSLMKSNGVECREALEFSALDGLDVLFVLGGDGTILTVASECARRGIKIIGINYGHVGFLAEFEREKLDEAVNLVCGGKYSVQQRSLIKVNFGGNEYLALNDLVLQRNTGGVNFCNTVSLRAEIDGVTVDNFSSDGIIVSTPTGSTAYSLAAGGSVLAPDINAFILTPICPHSLHSRPVVFGDNSEIKISPVNSHEPLVLTVDGKVVNSVKSGEVVTVQKADLTADFITKDNKNFFNKLLIKLNIWSK